MKIKLLTILAVCLMIAPLGMADEGEVGGLPVCAVMSWSPEIFTFYGDSATVASKLKSIDRDLLKHRVFAFIVESKDGSQLALFEVQENGVRLGELHSDSFSALSNDITATLLSNQGGKQCAGMLAQKVIDKHTDGAIDYKNSQQRPATMLEAFNSIADLTGDSYIRATFVLLC